MISIYHNAHCVRVLLFKIHFWYIMGVCHLQHRILTGLFAGRICSPRLNSKYSQKTEHMKMKEAWGNIFGKETRRIIYSFTITFYLFIIFFLLAVANKLSFDQSSICKDINFIRKLTKSVLFDNRSLINCNVLAAIVYVAKINWYFLKFTTKKFGVLTGVECRRLGLSLKIRVFLSFWHTILNLLLIVITYPAIKNPGPNYMENFTCLYQNVRGFVPFSTLGRKIPSLDTNKITEFQSYIFE